MVHWLIIDFCFLDDAGPGGPCPWSWCIPTFTIPPLRLSVLLFISHHPFKSHPTVSYIFMLSTCIHAPLMLKITAHHVIFLLLFAYDIKYERCFVTINHVCWCVFSLALSLSLSQLVALLLNNRISRSLTRWIQMFMKVLKILYEV